ncbi:unnamed protein product [Macrosiphum euphorbiae]|uniref:Uncharacterized protein n=1 Tax=Macrosiphum euphorbiae TaxID=13131 RepID=A0AAV0Y4L2_9HEMI|nr:unnamed protein product [Macrosiphum euphorbiae]
MENVPVPDDEKDSNSPISTEKVRDTIFQNIIRAQFGTNGLTFITNLSALFALLFIFILTVLIYMSVDFYGKIDSYEKNKLNIPVIVNAPDEKSSTR